VAWPTELGSTVEAFFPHPLTTWSSFPPPGVPTRGGVDPLISPSEPVFVFTFRFPTTIVFECTPTSFAIPTCFPPRSVSLRPQCGCETARPPKTSLAYFSTTGLAVLTLFSQHPTGPQGHLSQKAHKGGGFLYGSPHASQHPPSAL